MASWAACVSSSVTSTTNTCCTIKATQPENASLVHTCNLLMLLARSRTSVRRITSSALSKVSAGQTRRSLECGASSGARTCLSEARRILEMTLLARRRSASHPGQTAKRFRRLSTSPARTTRNAERLSQMACTLTLPQMTVHGAAPS